MPKQHLPFEESPSCHCVRASCLSLQSFHDIYKGSVQVFGDTSSVHSPPGTACHEALKPLPFIELSVLKRTASSFPVLETCMGFSDDLWAHSWAIRGEWKSGPP